MVVRLLFLSMILIVLSGCVSKKEIKLESLSLISKQKVDESYLTQKYVSSTNSCVTTISQIYNQPNEISDKFLRIVFSSKEKVFLNGLEHKGQPPYIQFTADENDLTSIGLCPLVKREEKHYINTIYYPISMKSTFGKSFNLNKIKMFSFYLITVDYFRWKTNEIIITKDMIDKLGSE